ncbi:MAG TPA: AAA family ATPase [Oligoflexia bacterium]|nr:AAA family ATPase [Oligoflexia bacterium]
MSNISDPELIRILTNKEIQKPPINSMIFWGPPGSGKTTLARLIGKQSEEQFIELSATDCGVKEIREIITTIEQNKKSTIVFLDEIHRFNKNQQDILLASVEKGLLTLIGATTENPSFYINQALISRVRIIQFFSLNHESLQRILDRAAKILNITIEPSASSVLLEHSGGDARKLLNILERISIDCADNIAISSDTLKTKLPKERTLFYDRQGEEHYNQISAFHKSLRGSDVNAALYWCFRMIESGEDPRYLLRRMLNFAAEDIGNADPRALQLVVAAAQAHDIMGLPESKIVLAQCVAYLATAPKSNASYVALQKTLNAIKQHPKAEVPLQLRNAPTQLMKSLGYGENYSYPHNFDNAYIGGIQYLPKQIKDPIFYEPVERGYEKTILERMRYWESIKHKN